MSLTQEKINGLKKLTALKQGEGLSIDGVLDSFEALRGVSLENITHTTRSGKDSLLAREDREIPSPISSEALLSCSPQKVIAHQISLASIMHGE